MREPLTTPLRLRIDEIQHDVRYALRIACDLPARSAIAMPPVDALRGE
jgi:hypothetical protein